MPITKFPWNNPELDTIITVNEFLEGFNKFLEPNQVELLEFFKDKIFGFQLVSLNALPNNERLKSEALFVFEHLGVKGEIKISF